MAKGNIQLGNAATCEWAAGEDREDPRHLLGLPPGLQDRERPRPADTEKLPGSGLQRGLSY